MHTRASGLKVYLISKGQVKPANKQFNPNGQYYCPPGPAVVHAHERTPVRASVHAALTSREHAPYSTYGRRRAFRQQRADVACVPQRSVRYELTLDQNSLIELCDDTSKVPSMK